MPKLLDENSLRAVKTVLDTKENVGNKVALGASNTTAQYPNAKSVWDEMVNVREVAEGKCQSYVISCFTPVPTEQSFVPNMYKRADGSLISTWADFLEYVGDYDCINNDFDSDTVNLQIYGYIVTYGNFIIRISDFKVGDNVFISELDVPDRWYSETNYLFLPLETQKPDLTPYPTKAEVATDFSNIVANEYDNTQTYAVGDLCLHNMQLYKCITAITVAEDFDSSKWVAVKINGEFARDSEVVKLTGDQTITGVKTFNRVPLWFGTTANSWRIVEKANGYLAFNADRERWLFGYNSFAPSINNSQELGDATHRFATVRTTSITNNTNSVTVADLANLITYAKAQGWIS